MFERLGGIWFGMGLIAIWTIVCALLLSIADDALQLGLGAALWLLVIVPTIWGLRRSRLG